MLHRYLAAALIAVFLAGLVQARPYSVDDMLRLQSIGHVAIDARHRWLVVEKRGPYSEMPRFDQLSRADILRSRLFVVDLRKGGLARPLIADGKAGTILLGFSPAGSELAVARWEGAGFRLGTVTMETGKLRWWNVVPGYDPFHTIFAWVSESQLLLIAETSETFPWWLQAEAAPVERATARWASSRAGGFSATVMGSGRLAAAPHLPERQLVAVDIEKGVVENLAHGHFVGLSLAPGGVAAALVEEGEGVQPTEGGAVTQMDFARAQRLTLVDVKSRTLWRACDRCTVEGMPVWDAQGQTVAARVVERSKRSILVADRAGKRSVTYPASDATPPDMLNRTCDLEWRGATLFFKAKDGWRRVVGTTSKAQGIGACPQPSLAWLSPVHWRKAGANVTIDPPAGPSRDQALIFPVGKDSRIGALSALRFAGNRSYALVLLAGPEGTGALHLVDGRSSRVLMRLNDHLADVDPAGMHLLHHVTPSGKRVADWLFLPARPKPAQGYPLVVIPYPGYDYGEQPPADQMLGGERLFASAQLLAGHGFAVLLPTLPMPSVLPDDGFDFAGLIDPAVEAAIGTGAINGRRLALFGHSYGAYASAMAASQSQRYRAIILWSGIYDLAGTIGALSPIERAAPDHGIWAAASFAWAEAGQGRMGVPPWRAPMRYAANSPVYRVDRIVTPVLIIAADRDISPLGQAEQLFTSLVRQGRDAQLVTYWGEGHVLASPANVRDFDSRLQRFLNREFETGQAGGDAAD